MLFGPGVTVLINANPARLTNSVGANLLFPEITLAQHKRLQAAGAGYHPMSPFDPDGADDQTFTIRLVTSFRTREEDVDRFLGVLAG